MEYIYNAKKFKIHTCKVKYLLFIILYRYVQKNPDSEKETLYNGYCLSRDAEPYCTVRADEPGKVDLWLNNTADAAQTYFCLETGTLDEASADIIWISKLSRPTGNFLLMFIIYTTSSSICMQTAFYRKYIMPM